jgi:hypothetical protein
VRSQDSVMVKGCPHGGMGAQANLQVSRCLCIVIARKALSPQNWRPRNCPYTLPIPYRALRAALPLRLQYRASPTAYPELPPAQSPFSHYCAA